MFKVLLPVFHLSFANFKYHLGPFYHQHDPPFGALGIGLMVPGYDSDVHATDTVGSLVLRGQYS